MPITNHNSYKSTDCTSALMTKFLPDSEIAQKISSARTKTEAIVNSVISPHAVKSVVDTLIDIPFCGVATDASNHLAIKIFPLMIQYFDWENGGIQTKLLDVQSKPGEKAQTIADYVYLSLKKFNLIEKTIAFTGDNCNTMFGGIARASTNNVFAKLQNLTSAKLIGVGCPAHILNNCIQHGMDALDVDIQSIILKIYNYFSVSTVRTESLKEFCNFVDTEYKQLLYQCQTRWLSIFPAVERVLQIFEALKSFFLSQSKPPLIIRRFFENNFSEIYLWFLHSFMSMFQINVDALQKEGTYVIEMQLILMNVKTSIEDRITSTFVPLKVKKMLSEMKEDGHFEECKKFTQQVGDLYISCLDYLNMWIKQFHELSPFISLNLNGPTTWNEFQKAIEYADSKGVSINETKCFDDFCHVQRYLKENLTNSNFCSLLAHEKWAMYFKSNHNAINHPELLKFIQFCFAIPAHNGNVERVFSLMQCQWSKERNRLTPDSIKGILTVQYNYKSITCEKFYSYVKGVPELLKQIGSTEKYDWAKTKDE